MTYIENKNIENQKYRFEYNYNSFWVDNIDEKIYDFIDKKIKNGDWDYIIFENTNLNLQPLRIKNFMKFDDFKAVLKEYEFIPNIINICDYIWSVIKTNHWKYFEYRINNEILDMFLECRLKD